MAYHFGNYWSNPHNLNKDTEKVAKNIVNQINRINRGDVPNLKGVKMLRNKIRTPNYYKPKPGFFQGLKGIFGKGAPNNNQKSIAVNFPSENATRTQGESLVAIATTPNKGKPVRFKVIRNWSEGRRKAANNNKNFKALFNAGANAYKNRQKTISPRNINKNKLKYSATKYVNFWRKVNGTLLPAPASLVNELITGANALPEAAAQKYFKTRKINNSNSLKKKAGAKKTLMGLGPWNYKKVPEHYKIFWEEFNRQNKELKNKFSKGNFAGYKALQRNMEINKKLYPKYSKFFNQISKANANAAALNKEIQNFMTNKNKPFNSNNVKQNSVKMEAARAAQEKKARELLNRAIKLRPIITKIYPANYRFENPIKSLRGEVTRLNKNIFNSTRSNAARARLEKMKLQEKARPNANTQLAEARRRAASLSPP